MSGSARKDRKHGKPVFVIGCGRSGTTLLYHMIVSSGNFANYRTESNVINLLEPRFRPLSSAKNKRRMLDAWYNSKLYTRSGLQPAELEPIVMAQCQNGGDFLRIIMELMCAKQGVERWAETTPEHLLYLRRIKETIPEALIVHVIRDGRDVALSWEKLRQIRALPWDRQRLAMSAGIHWEWIVKRGREVGRTLGNDYIEVHYEDVVRKPREVLARLEPFIDHDLNYDRIQKVAIGSVAVPNTAFKDGQLQPDRPLEVRVHHRGTRDTRESYRRHLIRSRVRACKLRGASAEELQPFLDAFRIPVILQHQALPQSQNTRRTLAGDSRLLLDMRPNVPRPRSLCRVKLIRFPAVRN